MMLTYVSASNFIWWFQIDNILEDVRSADQMVKRRRGSCSCQEDNAPCVPRCRPGRIRVHRHEDFSDMSSAERVCML